MTQPTTPAPTGRRLLLLSTSIGVLTTLALGIAGYLIKTRCVGGPYDPLGATSISLDKLSHDLCFTDVQALWTNRKLGLHLFPYLSGAFEPPATLTGGTLEYPVLTGLFIWLTALPVGTDSGLLRITFVIMLVLAVGVTVLLFRLAGRRAWLWALAPGLALYTAYNWDMIPALVTTAGIAVGLAGPRGWSVHQRAVVAALLFGTGGAFKLYPVMFVLPLALWVLFEGRSGPSDDPAERPAAADSRSARLSARRPRAVRSALLVLLAGGGVMVAYNVPFMIAGFSGWWAAFQFQAVRPIDGGTLSVWYWGLEPWSDPSNVSRQALLFKVSTVATAVGVLLPALAGLLHVRRGMSYPWVQVSASMLCAYLLLNKVNSPQYLLWLIPFFVIVRIRIRWVLAYYFADLCVLIGFYRSIYYALHGIAPNWAIQSLAIGVWGRAALLVCLSVAFLGSPLVRPVRRSGPGSALPAAETPTGNPAGGPVAALQRRRA